VYQPRQDRERNPDLRWQHVEKGAVLDTEAGARTDQCTSWCRLMAEEQRAKHRLQCAQLTHSTKQLRQVPV
jgi:hypothetical protein